jgi:hypothetical protein
MPCLVRSPVQPTGVSVRTMIAKTRIWLSPRPTAIQARPGVDGKGKRAKAAREGSVAVNRRSQSAANLRR